MSMKTSYGTPWFVAIGVSAIVFIGAFGRFDPAVQSSPAPLAPAKDVVNQIVPTASTSDRPLTADMSPGLAEVVRLAEAHVDRAVILAFIQNSSQTYSPTADQILYLSSLGMPQKVIAALYQKQPEQVTPAPAAVPASAPTPTAVAAVLDTAQPPPPGESSSNMFTDALAPYGTWMQLPNYGAAWQPAVELANPDWKPYVNDGQWLDSDNGWYWQSAYTWGWAPFHYGGWVNAPQAGWVWVPGNTWAPAWVSWRSTSTHLGWAPLPPGVSLNVLSQLAFNGHPISTGFDFDLTPSSYVFVRASHFLNSDLPNHIVPAGRTVNLVARSTVAHVPNVVNNKVVNLGVSRNVVAAASQQAVPKVTLDASSAVVMPNSPPPTLLASAQEATTSSASSMQLPPLHFAGRPAFGFPFRHDVANGFAHHFGGGPPQPPGFAMGGPPRLWGEGHWGEGHPSDESRGSPAESSHSAPAAVASSNSKSSK
jgi:hypothetical protein